MKRIVHPPIPAGSEPKLPEVEMPSLSDISIERLIEDGLLILYREIKNLLALSMRGKLEATDAKDLRDHLKLLFELKGQQQKLVKDFTDEELAAAVSATNDKTE